MTWSDLNIAGVAEPAYILSRLGKRIGICSRGKVGMRVEQLERQKENLL